MDDWTSEELERFRELLERANRELEERNKVSDETHESLSEFNKELSKSSSESNKVSRMFKGLGNSLLSYTSAVQQGERGASVMGRSVNDAAKSAGNFLSTLGPLGKAAGAVTKAFGQLSVVVGDQADQQYNALRELQRFGATANDGLEGMAHTVIGLNLTTVQLMEMARMIGNQSESLALFQHTVGDARKELASIGAEMKGETGLTRQLMLLGMSAEGISEAMVNFVGMQSEVGMTQQRNALSLANATGSYLKEINALTKATGIEREALEDKIRSMREEERFRAYTATLRAQGRGDFALSAEVLTSAMGNLFDDTVAKGFRDILAGGGAITSEDAQKLLVSTGMSSESIQKIAADFESGRATDEETLQRVAEALGESAVGLRESGLPQVGALGASGVFVEYATMARAAILAQKDFVESIQEARRIQTGEIEEPEGNLETLVDLTQLQINQSQNLSDIIQNFMGLNKISLTLAKTFEGISDAAAGAFGAGLTDGQGNFRDDGTPSGASRRGSRANRSSGEQSNNISTRGTRQRREDSGGNSEITELVSHMNAVLSSGELTVGEMISTPKNESGDWAAEISRYMGVDSTQILEPTPENIGKIVMGLIGKQTDGNISSGEEFKDEIRQQLRSQLGTAGEFRKGGIATGPESGYFAELHGTEAIVPLSGGSIPVTISNLQQQMMTALREISGDNPQSNLQQQMMTALREISGDNPQSNLEGQITTALRQLSGVNIANSISSLESSIATPMQQLAETISSIEDLTAVSDRQTPTPQLINEDTEMLRYSVEQISALKDQITRLDRLIQVTQSNNSIMSKILQNSYA